MVPSSRCGSLQIAICKTGDRFPLASPPYLGINGSLEHDVEVFGTLRQYALGSYSPERMNVD